MKRPKIIALSLLPFCYLQGCGNADRVANVALLAEQTFTINGENAAAGQSEIGDLVIVSSATGDMNDDGRDDVAAVLRLNSQGSGVFYFLNVLLLDDDGSWKIAGEAFLGDRIRLDHVAIYAGGDVSPLTGVAIHPDDYGQVVVAYDMHTDDQSFADIPVVFMTRHWRVTDGRLVLVEDY